MDQSRIKLTAEEIYKQEFKVDTKGYRIKEVDSFLDEIIKDYQEFSRIIREKDKEKMELMKEIMILKEENRNLKVQVELSSDDNVLPRETSNLDLMKRLSKLEKIVYGKEEK